MVDASVFVDLYVKDPIGVWSIRFSPNGQFLATGSSDGQIRVCSLNIGVFFSLIPVCLDMGYHPKRMRGMFKGHKSRAVNSVPFSLNGRYLVSGSDDGSVRFWNIRDGSSKVLPVADSPSHFVAVVFNPDGRYVAAGNFDTFIWIWDSRTLNLVAKWSGCSFCVSCMEFTLDGKGLISGGLDKTVCYWDVSLLGNRQGASTRTVVNNVRRLPEPRRFLGHNVRCVLVYSTVLTEKPL